MNPEWSELNKAVQIQLKNEATFSQGIETLLALRQFLMDELLQIKEELSKADRRQHEYQRILESSFCTG